MAEQNYTLGRGTAYFARIDDGVQGPFREFGNAPEFNLTIETENLPHFSSRSGVREQDDNVELSVTRNGTMVVDAILDDNLALFFFGDAPREITKAAVASKTQDIGTVGGTSTKGSIKADTVYQLGLTATDPVGDRFVTLTSFQSDDSSPVELVSGTDFELDADNGLLTILKDRETTAAEKKFVITYAVKASKFMQITSGSKAISGALKFVEDNPKGTDHVFDMPKTTIRPNGDISLIGDEWRQIPFAVTVEKPDDARSALYINGEAVATT